MSKIIAGYSTAEEIANAVSHGIGALLSVAALTVLLTYAISLGDIARIVSYSVYGISLLVLFLASTLYHAITHQKAKMVFKLLDHCAIYLLIAGTYTPLLTVAMQGSLANVLLSLIWILAVLGIAFKIKFGHKYKFISLATYLGLGGLSVFFINHLYHALSTGGFALLAIGGAFYAGGVIFYVNKKIPYNHAIWHLFVLAGAISHFLMIRLYA